MYIDTPTVLIYLFWIFFFGLIVYLRREDKREGYPLESDRQNIRVQGWPSMPEPKPARAKHPALVGAGPVARAVVIEETVVVVETEDATIVAVEETIIEPVDPAEHDEEEK